MRHSLGIRAAAEFVGTFTLCLTVGCVVGHGLTVAGVRIWAGTAIALALVVMIYGVGPISGAHLNPAVSATLVLAGKESAETAGAYAVVQLLAGVIAGGVSWGVTGAKVGLGPAKGVEWYQAAPAEVFYTLLLCFVVLNVACVQRKKDNQFFGIAIGFVIIAAAYAVGGLSGAALNPAVALSFVLPAPSKGSTLLWFLAYTSWELLGAAVAVLLFRVIRPDEFVAEAPAPNKRLASRCIAEFTGTFFLVLTVGLNALGASPATPWSAAAALMCMIYALGDVSGAHFNPAVTVAILAGGRQKITGKDAGIFIGMQMLGGILAAVVYALMRWNTFPLMKEYEAGRVVVCEFVFTFVLCIVVLCTATRDRAGIKDFAGLAIASCVTAGGFAAGPWSGGALNPAVAVGVELIHLVNNGTLMWGLCYAGVEVAGGAAAAGAFRVLYPSEFPKSVLDQL